jgi:NTP pyrophosphatase (non-canonical NTP hydrolase)
MDVASPLTEYVNSGRMMSMDEISEIIKAVRSADKYKADADRLAEALGDLICLTVSAMKAANKDCGEFDIDQELSQARAALAAHERGEG